MNNLSQKELDNELLNAVRYGYGIEVVKYLVETGAKVNVRDKWIEAPLHLASYDGHLEIVKYLVEAGADVNHLNFWWDKTPLHLASKNGHLEVVNYLKSKGGVL